MLTFIWLLLLRFLFLDTDSGGSDDDDPDDDGDGSGAGDPPGDGDGVEPDDAEATKNPKARIKSLLGANARLIKKLKERDERIAELAAGSDDGALQEARLQAAFWRTVHGRETQLVDADTAYELATNKGYFDTVKPDGEGMQEALDRLCERYPYLVADEDEEEPSPVPSAPSGRQPLTRSKEAGRVQTSQTQLKDRFPVLRRRVGKH